MDFFPSVDAEHHIVHLPVHEFLHLVVQQNSVGGQCKTKMLVMKLLLLPSIGDQILHHLPVHKRLPAEEIHFQILPAAGAGNQKIKRLSPHLITHQGAASMVFSFLRKAVPACQIAVVGNVQTERLYHRLFRLHNIFYIPFIDIFRIQPAGSSQLIQIRRSLPDLLLRIPVRQKPYGLFQSFFLIIRNHIIDQLVHHMNRTAVHIQKNIVTIIFILVNHMFPFLILHENKQRRCRCSLFRLIFRHADPICCARSSGSLPCRKSCMQTDRMSGIRRIRPSSWCSAGSAYLKS